MIDLVSLAVKKDFAILLDNGGLLSFVRHIRNVRTVSIIGEEMKKKRGGKSDSVFFKKKRDSVRNPWSFA